MRQICWYESSLFPSQIPILYKIRHISISKDDNLALVSYEGMDPPQLWKMTKTWDVSKKQQLAHLSLVHTYLAKQGDEFTIPSCFAGVHDELVICARKRKADGVLSLVVLKKTSYSRWYTHMGPRLGFSSPFYPGAYWRERSKCTGTDVAGMEFGERGVHVCHGQLRRWYQCLGAFRF